jgi:hypothetical protein
MCAPLLRARDFRGLELQLLAKVINRRPDPAVKINFRFPAKQLARPRYVGLSHLWVIDGELLECNAPCSTGDSENLFGKLFDRHFHRIPDVHGTMLVAHGQAKNSFNQIRNVAEAPRLTPIAEDCERLIIQSLANKRWNYAPIPKTHSRSVGIEDSNNFRVHPVKTVVCHRHRLGKSLRFVVNTARPDRIYISPIILVLRVYQRIAVTFRSGSEEEFRAFVLRQSERIMGSQRSDLQCRNWMFEIVDGTCRRRKLEHKVHGARNKNEFRNVVPDKSKVRISSKMFDVVRRSGNEIINCDDAKPFAQQTIAEVRTQESRAPGNYSSLIRQL